MELKTDSELVALAHAGDRQAFGQLIERYSQMVKRIALGMIAHEETARELVQETFLQAYLSLEHLRDNTRFKSWLYGIALNVCRSYIREQKSDTLSLESLAGGMRCTIPNLNELLIDPQTLVEQRELHQVLLDAVQSLSLKERTVTLLFYYEQLSLQEIAELTSVSVVAIKGRLHRARKQLREYLLIAYMDADTQPAPGRKQRRTTMINMLVNSVRLLGETEQWVVVLQEEMGERLLIIWIGKTEALALATGLAKKASPRPLTAELMVNLLKASGTEVEEVRVESLKNEIFYSTVKIRNGDTIQEVDARPSDALTLAVLMDRPIRVSEEVLKIAGITLPEGERVQQTVDPDQTASQLLEDTFGRFRSPSLSAEQIDQGREYIISQLIRDSGKG
jgi:RNA polymerase sigma factor (sigma-70 family)